MPKRVFNTISAFLATLVLGCSSLLAPALTHASAQFSYGDGSPENPYKISNCEQLAAIANDLDASYELIVNIDCGSANFAHIGDSENPFTGTLEGNDHIIRDVRVNDLGLFGEIHGASDESRAAVKNLKLINVDVVGSQNVGSLAGKVQNVDIINVHSWSEVRSVSGPYVGGLIGFAGSGSLIMKNSFHGTVIASGVVGGFIGTAVGSNYIQDNYAVTTITVGSESSSSVGGFFGTNASYNTQNNYAVTTIDAADAGFNTTVGGFVGVSSGGQTFSFAVMDYNSGAAQLGDFMGLSASSTIGSDRYKDNGHGFSSNSADPGAGGAQAVNMSSNPGYFFDQNNVPLSSWDFYNTWKVQENDYPTLIGEDAFSDVSNDINGDEVNDTYQANVIGVPDDNENLTVVELNNDTNCSLDPAGSWIDSGYYKEDPDYPLQIPRMTAFTVYCPTVGAQVQVTLIYPDQYDTSDSVLRFYNPDTNEYHNVSNVTFGTRVIGGNTVTTATYLLVDGGENDTDGVADGVIHDPVGIAVNNAPVQSSSSQSGGNSSNGTSGSGLASTGQSTSYQLLIAILLIAAAPLTALMFKKKLEVQER